MSEKHAPMPGAESLAEPLRDRWSISVYDDQHTLSGEQVETLLHAAQWSPSAGNRQPWAFFVAQRGTPAHKALVEYLSRGNSRWVPRASAVFITAAQIAPDPEGEGPTEPAYSFYDLGQAAAHLTIQAHSMGLRVHQFNGFDTGALAEELGVPAWWRVMSGIAVGVHGDPAEVSERDAEREQRVRRRKPLRDIARGDTWAEPWDGLSTEL
ncbi:nitroreductase family protein [Nocardioides insulae]|uniref:nitroreductase family protein n=1 Tax=Nocardioides insulae TaxID=394734 RepID=UPI000425770B|nr:nitroreductase family protein [Nocardioides insulae]